MTSRVTQFMRSHHFFLAVVVGALVVVALTLLSFSSHPINFDMVGQQVLVDQWLRGQMEGSVTGPTNFLVKALVLYAPLQLIGVPRYEMLIGITATLNIATYVLLAFILRRIVRLYRREPGALWSVALVWFAALSS